MKLLMTTLTLAALSFGLNGTASAATQTLDASNPGLGENFWTPDDASKYDWPYYRWNGEDWEWQFEGVAGTITDASLSISAYDVDADGGGFFEAENDEIYAWNLDTSSWDLLGSLDGASDIWSFTSFDLASSWADEINAGLRIKMVIDTANEGWAIALAKSTLITNGDGTLPNPNPGAVPVPAAIWLFGSALAGLGAFGKRRKAVEA